MTTQTQFHVRSPNPILHVRHELASGSNSIGYTGGAWRTINLSSPPKQNTVDGGIAVASNQITGVPAGKYRMLGANIFVYGAGASLRAIMRLYNVTAAAELLRGAMKFFDGTRQFGDSPELQVGEFDLAATSTLEFQIYASNSLGTTNGANEGGNEVFFDAAFERIG